MKYVTRAAAVIAAFALLLIVFTLPAAAAPAPAEGATGPATPAADAGVTNAGARLFLPVIVNKWRAPEPSSFAKIEADQAAGRIDAETALLYEVYAAFGDPALPAQYRSRPSPATAWDGHEAVRHALAQWRTLSAPTQQALAPFIQPPIYVGSAYDRQHFGSAGATAAEALSPTELPSQRPGWKFVLTGNGKAKVWWDDVNDSGDAKKAGLIATLLDEIWPKETGLMGPDPLPDAGPHEFVDATGKKVTWGDGGDGLFDVYIEPCEGCGGAGTMAYPPNCMNTPAYIYVDPSFGDRWFGLSTNRKELEAALSHEFMHAIQYAYKYAKPCDDYRAFEEASAEWAVDYVYPDNQHELIYPYRMERPDKSLFGGYSDWSFLYYLTKTLNPSVYAKAWKLTEKESDIEAVQEALTPSNKDGFKYYWPDFAVKLWNRAPQDFFWQNDQMDHVGWGHPMYEYKADEVASDYVQRVTLGGKQSVEYKMPVNLPALSIRFFHFTFPDWNVRSVNYQNLMAYTTGMDPFVKIQALVRLDGHTTWEPVQDWTQLAGKGFCRQFADERIDELALIFSYSEWQDKTKTLAFMLPPSVTASNIACKGWQGTVTTTNVSDAGPRHDEDTEGASVTFERVPPRSDDLGASVAFQVKKGTVHWEHTGSAPGCTIRGGPADIPLNTNDGTLSIALVGGPDYLGQIGGTGSVNYATHLDISCPDGSYQEFWNPPGWFDTGDIGPDTKVSADGTHMDGKYVAVRNGPAGTATEESEYHLQAVP